ncbi:hypothetical protein ESCO_001503 [Escovopsis weberi]|uniref:Carbohydrate-binding domain-containing protein n=1 Tax=Escovopsis weberi TaxID=150374 RepID=A0A0M9VW61_ESCWE|nr:hypothetical protein ESCO_001503 [Escovopsis weberi]
MLYLPTMTAAAALTGLAVATPSTSGPKVPSVNVPKCPHVGTVTYSKSVPDLQPFPPTQVSLCYTDKSIVIDFVARGETNFFFNASQGTNDDIWEYEVMEAFIYKGTDDPQTYLEFEVNPNNVTYQAFVYNPSKVRAAGAPFDHFFVSDPPADGFSAETTLDRRAHTWQSKVQIPLGLFNVDAGRACGTQWRMNFFRTTVSPETYPDQGLGAWSPPSQANFHMTPYMGRVNFV